jgi:hypothetical protein
MFKAMRWGDEVGKNGYLKTRYRRRRREGEYQIAVVAKCAACALTRKVNVNVKYRSQSWVSVPNERLHG